MLQAEAELTGRKPGRAYLALRRHAYDVAGLLQRTGFALPVADVDTVRCSLRPSAAPAVADPARAWARRAFWLERPARDLTRAVLARAFELYAARFSEPDGRIVATFEILTLTGWAPHPNRSNSP